MVDRAVELARNTRVFISYSRQNSPFAGRLRDGLIAAGIDAFLDKHDILPGEPWRERLSGLIAGADAMVACISPDWVRSEICDWEVNEAERLGKRLVPVVAVETPVKAVPRRLARLNFTFLRDEAELAAGLPQVVGAIETDIEWVREHTRIGELAGRWAARSNVSKAQADALLLRGPELVVAELWISSRPENAQEPTLQQRKFIVESRRAEQLTNQRAQQRIRVIAGASLTAAVLMAALGYFFLMQWRESQVSRVRVLAEMAQRPDVDPVTGMLLVLEGLPDRSGWDPMSWLRPDVPEAELALNETMRARREAAIISASAGRILSMDVNNSGSLAVTSGGGTSARIWDLAARKSRGELLGHSGAVHVVAFNADGSRVLTVANNNTAAVWDVVTRKVLFDLAHVGMVGAVFAPVGDRIATFARDRTARLYRARDGGLEAGLGDHKGTIHDARFSPDGRHLATAAGTDPATGKAFVRLWDGQTGKLLHELSSHTNAAVGVRFSPDGRLLASASWDRTVRIWSVETGREVFRLDHLDTVVSLAFARGIKTLDLATGTGTGEVRLWRLAAEGPSQRLLGAHTGTVTALVFNADGSRLISGSQDRTVRVWNAGSGTLIETLRGHAGPVSSVAFAAQGDVVTGSHDGTLRLWSVEPTHGFVAFRGHRLAASGAAFSPTGEQIVTSSWDGQARVWEARSGRLMATMGTPLRNLRAPQGGYMHAAVFHPDGTAVVTASDGGKLEAWQAATGEAIGKFVGHAQTDKVTRVAIRSDGQRLISASTDGTARLWDWSTRRQVAVLVHESPIIAAAFSADGRLAMTASQDSKIKLWVSEDGTLIREFRPQRRSNLTSAALGLNGSRIVIADTHWSSHIAGVYDSNTGLALQNFGARIEVRPNGTSSTDALPGAHTNAITSAAFSPDGRLVVTASLDGTARLWDVESGEPIATLAGHAAGVSKALFSPQGDRVATVSADRTATVWDVKTAKSIATLRGHAGAVIDAVFSADGSRILTVAFDDAPRLWIISLGATEFAERNRSEVPRCLTPEQRLDLGLPSETPDWCQRLAKWPYGQAAIHREAHRAHDALLKERRAGTGGSASMQGMDESEETSSSRHIKFADVHQALLTLDTQFLQRTLALGWNPNAFHDGQGNAALHILMEVCEKTPNHNEQQLVRMARMLMEQGGRADLANVHSDTPLRIASAGRYCNERHPVIKVFEAARK